jgi:CRISPR/Cas system-associated exonuclease Cas4 (RecB family)
MDTGQIRRVNDYRVVWLSGIELSEKDKAAVELQQAQARNLKTAWMTLDEIRAEEGKDPLPNGAGNVVLGVKKAEQQPFGQSPGAVSVSGDDKNPFHKFSNWIKRKLGRKDMLSEIIASYLKEQLPPERDYAVGIYYPSELPFCLRAGYFRYTLPKQTPADREQLFGVGYLWQACIEEALQSGGIDIVASNKIHKFKIEDTDLILVCQPDFELDVEGKRLIIEFKSVASLGKFTQPMHEHVMQIMPYLKVCKADSGLIVYLNKQTGEVKEFPVAFDPELLTLVFERTKRLDKFLQDKELPPKCGPGQDWQCKTCEYQTECETFRNDSNEVKK